MLDLLRKAHQEIVDLRRRNEILQAKVDMIDLFACVLHSKPAQHSVGFAEDVAHQIARKIAALEAEKPAP